MALSMCRRSQLWKVGVRYFANDVNATKFPYKPRRSLLYVPGDSSKKITKSRGLVADCIVLDLEDGVALSRKEAARQCVREELDGSHPVKCNELAVRVNSIQSGLCDRDLEAVLAPGKAHPSTLVIPKTDSLNIIRKFYDMVRSLKSAPEPYSVITMVESAEGLFNMRDVLQYCSDNDDVLNHVAVIFGSDDFCADLGVVRSDTGQELLYARQKTVAMAKMFRSQAIDMVHINYKDLDSLSEYSKLGAQMGFTGKQVIHPLQVPVVQEAFAPSPERVKWAKDLIEAFNEHQKGGKGAFVFQDSMIDMPLLLQAQSISDMHDIISATDEK